MGGTGSWPEESFQIHSIYPLLLHAHYMPHVHMPHATRHMHMLVICTQLFSYLELSVEVSFLLLLLMSQSVHEGGQGLEALLCRKIS